MAKDVTTACQDAFDLYEQLWGAGEIYAACRQLGEIHVRIASLPLPERAKWKGVIAHKKPSAEVVIIVQKEIDDLLWRMDESLRVVEPLPDEDVLFDLGRRHGLYLVARLFEEAFRIPLQLDRCDVTLADIDRRIKQMCRNARMSPASSRYYHEIYLSR